MSCYTNRIILPASPLTPVTLLTGFLGSGKTTLLNRLLKLPEARDTAVLVNEFGAVAVDHHLVRESTETVMILDHGCLCCTVSGDLVRTLRDLYFKRAAGEIPAFRRVIIETTGLADPAPILHTLIELPLVTTRYTLAGVVTTVDAQHAPKQLDQQFESVKQIAMADRLFITHTDSTTPAQRQALTQRLTVLNPAAKQIWAADPLAVADFFDLGVYRASDRSPQVTSWLAAEAYKPTQVARSPLSKTQRQVVNDRPSTASPHDQRISSFVYTVNTPLDFSALENALEMLLSFRGDHILRLKGLVSVQAEARPRVIHGVQHTLYPWASLPDWPAGSDPLQTQIVFIVRDLSAQFVCDMLDQFLKDPVFKELFS